MINRKPYQSPAQRRRNREARLGWTMIAGSALAFAGMVYAAAAMDARAEAQAPHGEAAWSLVRTFAGEAYVVDHALTLQDCALALGRTDDRKPGEQFTCEREHGE